MILLLLSSKSVFDSQIRFNQHACPIKTTVLLLVQLVLPLAGVILKKVDQDHRFWEKFLYEWWHKNIVINLVSEDLLRWSSLTFFRLLQWPYFGRYDVCWLQRRNAWCLYRWLWWSPCLSTQQRKMGSCWCNLMGCRLCPIQATRSLF